ncbi:MAG: N-6 DNA methylase [Methyloprofundus sp.]|nr:N-6 DNA methylase [Methyloprofundus sp.]
MNKDLLKKSELGQVWTPSDIALEMAVGCLKLNPTPENIIDPASGPGTFTKAFYEAGVLKANFHCIDVDHRMKDATSSVIKKLGLKGCAQLGDYLKETTLKGKFDTLIMNPPYIRQENIPIDDKRFYHSFLQHELGGKVARRANLFALFLLKGIVDLSPGGILCAIVYDAISQTRYGQETLKLLERHAELISQKHVKTPFNHVLVDAQILFFKKRQRPLEETSKSEAYEDGLVFLNELLNVRRGTGLPSRKVFLAGEEDLYYDEALPFLVKQSTLSSLLIKPDQRAYLLKDMPNNNSSKAEFWLKQKASVQEINLTKTAISGIRGPISFNYYIRDAARHLFNPENIAVSDNFYVSIPKDDFPSEAAWLLLNSSVYLDMIVSAARNQGNGLSKLQLYEYNQVRLPDWRKLPKEQIGFLVDAAKNLILTEATYEKVRNTSDEIVKDLF